MNGEKWINGLDRIDKELVEEYVISRDMVTLRHARRGLMLRIGALAVCICLIIAATVPIIIRELPPNVTVPPQSISIRIPSEPPQHYGDLSSMQVDNSLRAWVGVSVTAELVEVLPDTYVFYNDCKQEEYRLLKMRAVKQIKGEMPSEEFLYLVPQSYLTDFTVYDRFVIVGMAQLGYEYSVMYNKSRGEAERFKPVLFGYSSASIKIMGKNFIPYDEKGNFDDRLWKLWGVSADRVYENVPKTLTDAEGFDWGHEVGDAINSIKYLDPENMMEIKDITSSEVGIYVPLQPNFAPNIAGNMEFVSVKYINGFPTNDYLAVSGAENNFFKSNAAFDEDDIKLLPDLASAADEIMLRLSSGELMPPRMETGERCSIFAWYAKTESGVIGVIRVLWMKNPGGGKKFDDAYYIIECDNEAYKEIERDALIKRIGQCDNSYVYSGEYDEDGMVSPPRILPFDTYIF